MNAVKISNLIAHDEKIDPLWIFFYFRHLFYLEENDGHLSFF